MTDASSQQEDTEMGEWRYRSRAVATTSVAEGRRTTRRSAGRKEDGIVKRSKIIMLAGALAMTAAMQFAPLEAQVGAPARPQRELSPEQQRSLRELASRLSRFDVDDNGVPSWLAGDLGPAAGEPEAAAQQAMRRLASAFRMTPDDSFDVRRVTTDDDGQVHVRLRQRYRKLPVEGSELIVHIEAATVVGINGQFTPDISVGNTPALTAAVALGVARRSLGPGPVSELSDPELTVFVTPDRVPHLAWKQKVTYVNAEGLQREWIFADARGGELLGRHPLLQTTKFRQVYDGNQACLQFLNQLPGDLVLEEGPSGAQWAAADDAARGAYTGTGKTYDFYKNVFNRKSYDGSDSPLVSSVHFEFATSSGCSPNNAAWVGDAEQMVYGDGDGVTFGLLSSSLDVTAHELTHGVTQFEADLVYSNESGALNEALSDILGESADYFFKGSTDWKIGEEVFTPGSAGDALRYMNSPSLDDPQVSNGGMCNYVSSRDYYPDRYLGSCDYGGVHLNSGIANLAFYLMSAGGSHPLGKTSVSVPAIGIEQARHIWYKALKDHLTSTATFSDARKATVDAAKKLYACKAVSPAIVDAVNDAWDAVGVPNLAQNGWAMLGYAGPIYTDTNPCVYVPPSFNLLLNPGFEKGAVIWIGRGVVTNSATQAAHAGTYKGWLGGSAAAGTETLYQQVTIPAVATTATLSFWLHTDTAETSNTIAYDTLDVQLRSANNTVLAMLATYSNLDKNIGYALKSFDVSAYAGQTLRVYFKATSNATKQTSFVVDDTALNVM
jgi:Zn-dependent metalloprotease